MPSLLDPSPPTHKTATPCLHAADELEEISPKQCRLLPGEMVNELATSTETVHMRLQGREVGFQLWSATKLCVECNQALVKCK